jgi:protein PhnA
MSLKRSPDLLAFFSTAIAAADPSPDLAADSSADEQIARDFSATQSPERLERLVAQAKQLLLASDLPIEEFGSEANRWFSDSEEARAWLTRLVGALEGGAAGAQGVSVKDSNGALLAEGDSVLVIKDLKVRGGSSDLKRGTLIKKIHLVDDPEVIECRVNGSTLVLKTCFLKKA